MLIDKTHDMCARPRATRAILYLLRLCNVCACACAIAYVCRRPRLHEIYDVSTVRTIVENANARITRSPLAVAVCDRSPNRCTSNIILPGRSFCFLICAVRATKMALIFFLLLR